MNEMSEIKKPDREPDLIVYDDFVPEDEDSWEDKSFLEIWIDEMVDRVVTTKSNGEYRYSQFYRLRFINDDYDIEYEGYDNSWNCYSQTDYTSVPKIVKDFMISKILVGDVDESTR